MKLINICSRIIEFSFYALFLLVPLVVVGDTSELFEFNKMWVAFGLGIVIAASWAIKSILEGQIKIQKTPLDIPILLFFASQILSTIFSWDRHVSIWGYYTRFNGGLLSTILYIFLYYAFVNNFTQLGQSVKGFATGMVKGRSQTYDRNENDTNTSSHTATHTVKRVLNISLITGFIVSLWGLPSHFGYDPTCFLFRGNLDVSCWAADFQPRVRIFSTLGQPDWLSAYLAILIPISLTMFVISIKDHLNKQIRILKYKFAVPSKVKPIFTFYFLSFILFYIDLLYTRSRSGILAVWITLAFLFLSFLYLQRKSIQSSIPAVFLIIIFVITFFIGQPFGILKPLTYDGLRGKFSPPPPPAKTEVNKPAPQHLGELGGTDSSRIRLLVWKGAIEAFKNNPIFGTGVETFAFAYYKYKFPAHNLTSEWNFLYNKAHNEFLNLLATSGVLGFSSYLLMLGYFLYISIRNLIDQRQSSNVLIVLGLLASYISISITNFFGFSVVIVNIYLFLIPAFVLSLLKLIDNQKVFEIPKTLGLKPQSLRDFQVSPFQWAGILVTIVISFYLIFNLIIYWNADKAYAYGANLDRVGYYQDAFPYLQKAVALRPGEPVFRDEYSINNAANAAALLSQKDAQTGTQAAQLASNLSQEAISINTNLVSSYPKNFVFLKTRIRIFYTLSQVDPSMLPQALDAARKAQALSPNDASINYNLGVIEGQSGNIDSAIAALERTVWMKPDYRDARYALGLFYNQKAQGKNGNIVDKEFLKKSIDQMNYILDKISSSDAQAKEALKTIEKK